MKAKLARQEPIVVLGRLNFWSNEILLSGLGDGIAPTNYYMRRRIALGQFQSAQQDAQLEINEITGVN